MTPAQERRLDFLVEAFKADAALRDDDVRTPADADGKRRLLRSLMNVRLPKKIDEAVLAVQDEYLRERIRERGIVSPEEIPVVRDRISIWRGDITRLAVDAVVNAANSGMLGCFVPMHACIDNCIHAFAGVRLRAECAAKMARLKAEHGEDYEQPTAAPMLTDAYNLPARKIVHVVGPIARNGTTPALEDELAACYRNVLDVCLENGLESVAFCCISTGVFRFPNAKAAKIAVRTTTDWLSRHRGALERVIFDVFGDEDQACYERLLR